MPYVYAAAAMLEGKPKVGNGDCVALVRHYAGVPQFEAWKAGASVLDNKDIRPGTAIATFVNGRYLSHDRGNHTAFFLRHDAPGTGFWVIDQWIDGPGRGYKPHISARPIRAKRVKQNADGSWPGASDLANAFSIIELR